MLQFQKFEEYIIYQGYVKWRTSLRENVYTDVHRKEKNIMDENTRKIIANNLRAARWKKKWSQAFVACQMGISIRTLSRAENHGTLSETLLKKLCLFYQIPLASIYVKKESQTREAVKVDMIPSDVVARIVLQSDFVNDIQKEAILRFNDAIQRGAIMYREDVEALLPKVISEKEHYSLSDVVYCCMMVNQQTINNIRLLSVG